MCEGDLRRFQGMDCLKDSSGRNVDGEVWYWDERFLALLEDVCASVEIMFSICVIDKVRLYVRAPGA